MTLPDFPCDAAAPWGGVPFWPVGVARFGFGFAGFAPVGADGPVFVARFGFPCGAGCAPAPFGGAAPPTDFPVPVALVEALTVNAISFLFASSFHYFDQFFRMEFLKERLFWDWGND